MRGEFFPRAHQYNYAIRSRGLWDLGNIDDGVCYGCNWKMVKNDRFCTRARLLLSLKPKFQMLVIPKSLY